MSNKQNKFSTTVILLQKIEDSILVGLLLVMITLAVLQIFLRNFFNSGLMWGDSLVRVLLLWIGLMGAMVASRNDNHICIDVISRYLPFKIKKITTFIVHLFTAVITAAMAWFSLVFVRMEMADNLIAFARVPAWVCELIIPVAFAVISCRYMIFSINHVIKLLRRKIL
jgi:TRAP-type C4-dicarboxylate transport system permease small subunit